MMGLCRVADTSILRGPCKDIKEGLITATLRVRLSSCRFRISKFPKSFFIPIPNRMLSYHYHFALRDSLGAERINMWSYREKLPGQFCHSFGLRGYGNSNSNCSQMACVAWEFDWSHFNIKGLVPPSIHCSLRAMYYLLWGSHTAALILFSADLRHPQFRQQRLRWDPGQAAV